MSRLSAEDGAKVLAAAYAMWPPDADFRAHASRAIRALVRCDLVMFNRTDLVTGEVDYVVEPVARRDDALALHGSVVRIGYQHPVVEHWLEGAGSPTLRVTDEVPAAEWFASEVFRELVEPLGVRWQLVQVVPSADGFLTTVSVARHDEDFSDRDVAILDALAPTLALGCGGVPADPSAPLDVTAGWLAVTVAADGTIEQVGPADPTGVLTVGAVLPAAVTRAELMPGIARPREVMLGAATWEFQSLGERRGRTVLLARTTEAEQAAVRRLTSRQAEILTLGAKRDPDDKVATELGLSERFVKRQWDEAVATLGAPNRAAAVAIWRRVSRNR